MPELVKKTVFSTQITGQFARFAVAQCSAPCPSSLTAALDNLFYYIRKSSHFTSVEHASTLCMADLTHSELGRLIGHFVDENTIVRSWFVHNEMRGGKIGGPDRLVDQVRKAVWAEARATDIPSNMQDRGDIPFTEMRQPEPSAAEPKTHAVTVMAVDPNASHVVTDELVSRFGGLISDVYAAEKATAFAKNPIEDIAIDECFAKTGLSGDVFRAFQAGWGMHRDHRRPAHARVFPCPESPAPMATILAAYRGESLTPLDTEEKRDAFGRGWNGAALWVNHFAGVGPAGART